MKTFTKNRPIMVVRTINNYAKVNSHLNDLLLDAGIKKTISGGSLKRDYTFKGSKTTQKHYLYWPPITERNAIADDLHYAKHPISKEKVLRVTENILSLMKDQDFYPDLNGIVERSSRLVPSEELDTTCSISACDSKKEKLKVYHMSQVISLLDENNLKDFQENTLVDLNKVYKDKKSETSNKREYSNSESFNQILERSDDFFYHIENPEILYKIQFINKSKTKLSLGYLKAYNPVLVNIFPEDYCKYCWASDGTNLDLNY